MKHLEAFIDAISAYPLEVDVLLFMVVCLLLLLIIAYGLGDRANHRFMTERNEAFLRKMRVSISLSSQRASLLDPSEEDRIRGNGEVQAYRPSRDEQRRDTADENEVGGVSSPNRLSQRLPSDTVRQEPAEAPLDQSQPGVARVTVT